MIHFVFASIVLPMSSKGLWCSLIALCAWSIHEAGAQLRVEQIPLSPVKSNTGFFLYGADNLKKEIPNSSINGTPFWNTELITATIYLEDGQPYSKRPVKLNIATNEINFLNKNGEEFIAQNGIIKKIVFHPSDSSDEVRAIFRNDIHLIDAYSKYKRFYIQELNQGKTQ